MRRPAEVTIAAIIALLGSALFAYVAVLPLFAIFFTFQGGELESAVPHGTRVAIIAMMLMGSLMVIGFAGWAIATGIGLLRLKSWARISLLVQAGLLAVFSIFIGLDFLLFPLPNTQNSSHIINLFTRIFMESISVVTFGIAVWWLVLFTRKNVVEQFSGTESTVEISPTLTVGERPAFGSGTLRPRRPLPITVIAWLYLASLPTMIPSIMMYQFQKMPLPFFGMLLEGRWVMIYFALNVSVLLAAGVALLKNQVWGFWLAFGSQVFALLNIAANALLPGSSERWEKFISSLRLLYPPEKGQLTPNLPTEAIWMGIGAGFLAGLIILGILWASRKRFFEFAAIQAQPLHKAE